MNPDDYKRIFHHASASFMARNAAWIRSADAQSIEGDSLVGAEPRKAPRVLGAVSRAKITFRIFSRRPADWDGHHVKELQDMLCKAGILDGDDWDLLEGRIISEQVHTKAEERTEITIDFGVHNV